MATIIEIENEIDTEAQAKFDFDLNATSNAGDWKLLRGIVAQAIFTVYSFFAAFKAEVALLAQSTEFGNGRWWLAKVLAFQLGHSLKEVDGKLYYSIIDPSAQIVKRVAVVEKLLNQVLVVQLKVAKMDGVNSVPLSDSEKTSLESYIQDIKPAGVATQIISLNPDEVAVTETIFFDGKLIREDFESKMATARNNYLAGIVFNGQFNINLYRDALEAICGQGNADVTAVRIKPNGGEYVAVSNRYNPTSGHYKLITDDCSFTYIPL